MPRIKQQKPSDTKKLGVVFTIKQIDALEKAVDTGTNGSTKAKVIETIVIDYLKEYRFLEELRLRNSKDDAIKGIIILYFTDNHFLD